MNHYKTTFIVALMARRYTENDLASSFFFLMTVEKPVRAS